MPPPVWSRSMRTVVRPSRAASVAAASARVEAPAPPWPATVATTGAGSVSRVVRMSRSVRKSLASGRAITPVACIWMAMGHRREVSSVSAPSQDMVVHRRSGSRVWNSQAMHSGARSGPTRTSGARSQWRSASRGWRTRRSGWPAVAASGAIASTSRSSAVTRRDSAAGAAVIVVRSSVAAIATPTFSDVHVPWSNHDRRSGASTRNNFLTVDNFRLIGLFGHRWAAMRCASRDAPVDNSACRLRPGLTCGEGPSRSGRSLAAGRLTYSGRMPQTPNQASLGESSTRSSPVARAFGGQVVGSIATEPRLRSPSRPSAV